MSIYKVYFEFYGRKMKVAIPADSATDAIKQIKNSVIIHKVIKQEDVVVDSDIFPDIFDTLFGKK
jgi:DNA polymerase III sliding clamp (beta) subunit (PCNA family)